MFFFDFGQIMAWAFVLACGAAVLGWWMALVSNAVTWAVNFAHDNENREYRWWYERMIMENWGDCEWNTAAARWTTDNYKNYFGPTDEDSNFRGNKRYAYWFGTALIYPFMYWFAVMVLGVCAYFWFLFGPIVLIMLTAVYMRGVVRRRKAAEAAKELEEARIAIAEAQAAQVAEAEYIESIRQQPVAEEKTQ